jgi:hypothetical protein
MARTLRLAVAAVAVTLLPVAIVTAARTAAHAATAGYPARYAAPYLEISSADVGDMTTDMNATGLKYYTLAFLIPQSGCTPMWENGNYSLGTFTSQVAALQSAGGNVIISFGGAAGGELAQTCTSVSSLTAAYQNVVNTYGVTRLDFDIEGSPLDDTASITRRDRALAALQAAAPSVQVDFTLPVDPTGLPSNAVNLLNDAKSNGVKVNLVNIMTMDFGDGENALNDAKSAANGTHSQLGSIFGGTSAQLWNMIGLTPIAGQNDDNEFFSQSDASNLESFAAANGVQELAFWEVDSYDKATGYAYSRIFNQITTGGPTTDDFSVTVSPASGSVVAGQSSTTAVSTAVTSGSAQQVTLSASGLPAGASASFSPGTVIAGGSSTLTVTTAASTLAGTYPVTVNGTAASGTRTAGYTLTVTTSGGGGGAIVNGGFETGDFTGWTRSGTTSIVSSPVHSGTHAALLGSTSPTNGDSKVSQTFTAPAGSSQLSFWYNMNCPDDVTWDWATATLRDNTTGTTATVLAKTCTLGAGWKQVTAGVTAGHSYTLTLVSHDESNPGDATDTTYDDVTVNGSGTTNDFSVSVAPGSGSVTAGQSATTTVSTAVTSGSAQTVALSASGLPSGVSAAFSPGSVTAGGSSTMTVTTSTSTPAGTYAVTITGAAASGTHTASYTLTVTSGGGTNPVVNGGFETGDFTGWTRSGTTSIVSSPVHSGTHAALLGSTSPTNGDSKVSQTFTAPAGSAQLSFWYNMNCPDDVTWDWATATLKDNTTGTTATVLARTCTLGAGWKQVTAAVTAGHSYTLTLVSHDENNPGDATDTTYDDIAIG